jgi:hypothetical protein
VKAAQHEASPAALRRKTPEAHDAGSADPSDGRAKAETAFEELAKSTEKEVHPKPATA